MEILIVALALILSSHVVEPPAPAPRARRSDPHVMVPGGSIVTTDRKTFATARVVLRKDPSPRVDAYAESMSLGPLGIGIPRPPVENGNFTIPQDDLHHRLRVTLGSCENQTLMSIEDIVIGRADSRALAARYWVDVYALPQWGALRDVDRVRGQESGSSITWLEPKRFRWTTPSDTLLFEQEADSLFVVTLRPRLK